YCIRNNKEIFINDMENEYYRYVNEYDQYIEKIRELQNDSGNKVVDEIPGSAIFIPVTFGEKVTGVISIQSYEKNSYTLDDLSDLRIIAAYAGIAFNNARNYARLEHSANHDFLTKLFTRSHILDIGKDIYKKSRELQLCVLMIDIDDFKKVNDNYGHTVGDIVLKKVAEIIKYSVRSHDHVGRYGGEEFIVLMNEVDAEIYLDVAERIRKNVAEHSNTAISPGEETTVTVSIGLSCMNIDKKEISQLIEESDKALYKAKAGGKNRVIVYED
ncbi:MAG: sensor domain-containing diguanylate cyclase, partial [Proteocatella sp.]